jgi:hypothetical protein
MGPSVEMWTMSGLNVPSVFRTPKRGANANRISE